MPQAPRCGAVAQLGEHLLCKQGVSGSIPLSSTKFSFTVSRSPPGWCSHGQPKNNDADLETERTHPRMSSKGFLPPQGGPFAKRRYGLMFDNEIDWVIAHRARVPRTGCREAAGRTFVAMTRIQGRAHCRAVSAQAFAANASVQCKKSVFRSAARIARERSELFLRRS